MEILKSFMNDPVFWWSVGGLAVVFSICAYYIYFFMKNINEGN